MHLVAFLSSVFITGTLATTAAVVNFANNTGAPEHLASGTLYGLPENGNQIPVSLSLVCCYEDLLAKAGIGRILQRYWLAI